MKKLFFITIILSWASFLTAQENKLFEVKDFDGNINITGSIGGLIVEGYDGNDVIIEAESTEEKLPEKAKGLKLVTPGGIDNTGLGINVTQSKRESKAESGDDINMMIGFAEKVGNQKTLNINIPNENKLYKNFRIRIPANNNVIINSKTLFFNKGSQVTISSLSGELEVNCSWCDIKVKDFSGNIVSNTSFGETYIEFSKFETLKPSYITSNGKDIEVILPSDTKADVILSSGQGNTYTDFDLELPDLLKTNNRDEIIIIGKPQWVQGFKFESPRIQVKEDTIRLLGGSSFISQSTKKRSGFVDKELKKALESLNTQVENIESISVIKTGSQSKPDYTINGGGSLLSIKNFTGNIYLRKKD